MAANTRTHAAPGWADGEILTHTQANAIDVMAAASVRRDSSQSGNKVLQVMPYPQFNAASALLWYINAAGNIVTKNSAGGAAVVFRIPLDLPHGQTLTSVFLSITPHAGHGVNFPAGDTLPSFQLQKAEVDGTLTTIASATHTWVDTATYEAGFLLTTSAFSEVIDNSLNSYFLTFTGEFGADSVDGLIINGMAANVTIDHAEGGVDISVWI